MAKTKTAVKTAENRLKIEDKEIKPVKSILPLVNSPETAVIRFGRDVMVSIRLDLDNMQLSGTLEVEGESQAWTAVADE